MKALLVMRANDERWAAFDGIRESLVQKEYHVETYEGVSRLCPIDLDIRRVYLTECQGNYLKLAKRIHERCPDCEIFDVSNGVIRFETNWDNVDGSTQEPRNTHIKTAGEPEFDIIDGKPMAIIVKFHAEPPWKEKIWNGIHEGLHKSGWNVKVKRMDSTKRIYDPEKADMIFQWAAKEPQKVISRQFKDCNPACVTVCVEHGYWQRNKYCVLMPNMARTQLNGSADSSLFKLQGRKKREYWVIPMQVHGDNQLKELEAEKPIWQWVTDAYSELRKYTDLPIKVRPHPVKFDEALNCDIPRSDILPLGNGDRWEENTIGRDLRAAYGVVAWNSTFIADAMLHDIPVIQMGDRIETKKYTLRGITKEIVEDIENRGPISQKLVRGYKKIVPQLAGQQKDYDDLLAMDWAEFYEMHKEA